MPAVTRKSIETWAREAMLDENYGKIIAIMLSFDNGYSPKEIDNVVFGTKSWDPKDLEVRFLGKCENYCGNTEGRHQFILQAFYSTDDKPQDNGTPRNQMSFVYDVATEQYTGMRVDTPNERGLLMQTMRHMEVMQDRLLRATDMAISASQISQNRLMERNEYLEKEVRESWDIVREMGNKLMDKRGEHELAQLKYQRNTLAIGQWMKFAPALLNQILGKEVFPQDVADSSLIEAVADALDQESIEFLASKLRPELWGVLSSRFTAALEKRAGEMQQDEKLLAGNRDPEAQAAGERSITRTQVSDE